MPIGRRCRAFLIGFACLLTPWLASAQSGQRPHRVAHVVFDKNAKPGPFTDVLRQRLAERGLVPGRNLDLRHFALTEGTPGPAMPEATRRDIEGVIAWQPEVIVVGSVTWTQLLKQATTTIPIVFANVQDPEVGGLVASLARPGGNVTGAATHYDDLAVKRLQLTRELLPSARSVAVLMDRRAGGIPGPSREVLEVAARRLGLAVSVIDVAEFGGELCGAAKRVMHSRASAILVWGGIPAPANYASRESWYADCLVRLQRETRLPVFDDTVDTVRKGVVLGLGEDPLDSYRRAGDLVARILGGEKPAALPVDIATRTELYVNARSARELGLRLPQSLQVRADLIID